MDNQNKYYCINCKKEYLEKDFYIILFKKGNYICKKCFQNEFKELCKSSQEETAFRILFDKYNLEFNPIVYTQIKNKTKYNPFTVYIRYISTLYKGEWNSVNTLKKYFKLFLNENDIIIDDIFKFDYIEALYKSELVEKLKENNIDELEFIVEYYDKKYPGYMFSVNPYNYYSQEKNIIFDFRYFVEMDKKILLKKLPIILNMEYLEKYNPKIHYLIVKNQQSNSNALFEMVNKCYPKWFKKSDFTKYKIKCFDSDEEICIDDELRNIFRNVVYNNRSEVGIKLDGMYPDWFIFTEKGVIIIEYFGLYTNNLSDDSDEKLKHYRENTLFKLKKYKNMTNYTFIDIYPIDLKRNLKGFYNKIDETLKKLNLKYKGSRF